MGISESEARDLTHKLLGTKQLSVHTTLFEDQRYTFDSVYRAVRQRAGRKGRAGTKNIPLQFANMLWSIELDSEACVSVSLGEGFVQERAHLDWTRPSRRRRRNNDDFMGGVYSVRGTSWACYSVDIDVYTTKESIYLKEHDMEIAEGSVCVRACVSIASVQCNRVSTMKIASSYKLGAGDFAEPLTLFNDDFLAIILPTKAKERLLIAINNEIKSVMDRDKK